MRQTLLILLMLIGLMGCDQNWAQIGDDGPAPGAPDCELDDDGYCVDADAGLPADHDGSNDKHPGIHTSYAFSTYGAPGTAGESAWCGAGADSAPCWWKWTEYGQRTLFYNSTGSNNVPPKYWWFDRITWRVCAPGINGANTANTIQMCREGFCADLTNQWSSNSGGCRSGTATTAHLGSWAIPPFSLRHIDLFVNLQEGSWMSNPQVWVSMSKGPYIYWD